MPECSPVILSVRSLSRDTQIEKNRVVEDTKIWSKNSDLVQRIFKSQETSILEVALEISRVFNCQKSAIFPPISVAKHNLFPKNLAVCTHQGASQFLQTTKHSFKLVSELWSALKSRVFSQTLQPLDLSSTGSQSLAGILFQKIPYNSILFSLFLAFS